MVLLTNPTHICPSKVLSYKSKTRNATQHFLDWLSEVFRELYNSCVNFNFDPFNEFVCCFSITMNQNTFMTHLFSYAKWILSNSLAKSREKK